jgi:predicted GNAT superfamily acetyltransferase
MVTWRLADPPGSAAPVGPATGWAVAADCDGRPVCDPAWRSRRSALVAVPADIAALRRTDPHAASAWQQGVGPVLQEALARGWSVGWDRRGGYLLTAPA